MNNLNFLTPDKKNLYTYLYLGLFLISFSILDVFLNSFFKINLIFFLPSILSFILPLIIGFIGLHLIRIEYSGVKSLDVLNKNINTNLLMIVFDSIKTNFRNIKLSGNPYCKNKCLK